MCAGAEKGIQILASEAANGTGFICKTETKIIIIASTDFSAYYVPTIVLSVLCVIILF